MFNTTCNSTLDDLRILPTSEVPVVGSLTFHQLALIIGGATTIIAIILSVYLMTMHALHYTKPIEQKHTIRILFMVPVYSIASWLSIKYYWHSIYFELISDCYEAFAISSFFALLCSYIAPDLHEQKEYFRAMRPVKPWVWPIDWFKWCCCGERGPWRTPGSGLTWFNIIWIGIYHYCFIRVAMTITAVITQMHGKYCESSNSPVFSHIWILVIESVAVTIAMFCVIQFYVQLKTPLAEHRPFLKVLAIKLVIFLSFWQSSAISIGTSTLNWLKPNPVLAYPDIKVTLPSLLLCVEMACFAILHLWAFPYTPYLDNAKVTFYPIADPSSGIPPRENEHSPRSGGPFGLRAFWDVLNLWDVVKAFGRGIRWLLVGVRHRHEDISYQATPRKGSTLGDGGLDMDELTPPSTTGGGKGVTASPFDRDTSYPGAGGIAGNMGRTYLGAGKSTDHLPIASEFRRSQYGPMKTVTEEDRRRPRNNSDERAGLISHAQPDPSSGGLVSSGSGGSDIGSNGVPRRGEARPYREQQYSSDGSNGRDDYVMVRHPNPNDAVGGMAPPSAPYYYNDGRAHSLSTVAEEPTSRTGGGPYWTGAHMSSASTSASIPIGMAVSPSPSPEDAWQERWEGQAAQGQSQQNNPRNSTQVLVGQHLWGKQPRPGPGPEF